MEQKQWSIWDYITTVISVVMLIGVVVWSYTVVRNTIPLFPVKSIDAGARIVAAAALRIFGPWLGALIIGMALNVKRFSNLMLGLRNILIYATWVAFSGLVVAGFAYMVARGWNLSPFLQVSSGALFIIAVAIVIAAKIMLDRLIALLTPTFGKHGVMDDSGHLAFL